MSEVLYGTYGAVFLLILVRGLLLLWLALRARAIRGRGRRWAAVGRSALPGVLSALYQYLKALSR